jgi:hypothetical protein
MKHLERLKGLKTIKRYGVPAASVEARVAKCSKSCIIIPDFKSYASSIGGIKWWVSRIRRVAASSADSLGWDAVGATWPVAETWPSAAT